MSNLIGQSIGRYHILEQIGEGGMAVVYKALDTSLDRYVAVKVILPYRQLSEKFLKRFEREARALAQLSHRNILTVFDYGEYEGLPYLVMAYIPGGTLAQKLTGKALPWQASAKTLACVARALEAAHAHGIIHRDVKPANILISNTREPLLSDFGIAKLVESDQETMELTGSGVGIGTPSYMAPEQGEGRADARSDVYALGVVFYEMVTGRRPYEADTPMAIMLKKNMEPLPRPTRYAPDLPASVERVLIKALARDPNHRYADMAAFANALEYLAGDSSIDPDVDAESAPPDYKRWLPWAVSAVLLLACCVVGLAGGFRLILPFFAIPTNLSLSTPSAPEAATEIPSAVSEIPPPAIIFTDAVVPTSSFTPIPIPTSTVQQPNHGTWIAFNSRKSGNADIYLVDVDGNNLTQLTTSSAHDLYPSWSPDGTQIVYQTNEGGDQELAVIDIATKNVRKLTSNGCDDWGPSWSPDGVWIAYYSNCNGERNIYKMRADGGDAQQLTFESGSYNWFPSWSPDGSKITFSSNRSGKYDIYVMNANGNNQRQLAQGCVSYFSPDGSQILYGIYCTDTSDIWAMNTDGSNPRQITNGCECKNATWSPDGNRIVFEQSLSGTDGPFSLTIMSLANPDRSNWLTLTDDNINGRSPVWQP